MFLHNIKTLQSLCKCKMTVKLNSGFLKSSIFGKFEKDIDDAVHCKGPVGILRRVEGVKQVHVKRDEMKL